MPYCLFTDPPLARVGLSETEAKSRGVAVRVARLPMAAVLRTRTIGETRGFMKALVDARSDRILGFTMFGPEAGEVMAVVQTAMLAGSPYTILRDAILAHPTMAEGLGRTFCRRRFLPQAELSKRQPRRFDLAPPHGNPVAERLPPTIANGSFRHAPAA